jgi:hypothetical protein
MAISKDWKNLRDATPDSKSGKCVGETSQLKGEAEDSLSGKNSTVQYETSNPKFGTLGAKVKSN